MKFSGKFYKALTSKAEEAKIEIFNKKVTIIVDEIYVCEGIEIETIQSKKDIFLKNGFLFSLDNELRPDEEKLVFGKVERGISWLENFSLGKALLLSLILICFLVILRQALTSITPIAVSIFPHEWENMIGKNSYNALNRTIFKPSELSSERITRLQNKTKKLAFLNNIAYTDVLFHKADLIGANALAFAGGPIVVTDDLVSLLQKDDLVLSIIAHELAHVEERHSLFQIIEIIGISALASVLLGSDQSIIEEASFVGINFWANKKSREFEKRADLLALDFLEKANINKTSFAEAIKILTNHFCLSSSNITEQDCLSENESSWLSTHPSGAERMRYILKH